MDAFYPLKTNIHNVNATGVEAEAPDHYRWDLCQLVEQAIKEATNDKVASTDVTPAPHVPNPQKVVERLLAAKGEMDIMLDLVSFVEQEQFLNIAYVPQANITRAAAQERASKLTTRGAQLKDISQRLLKASNTLERQLAVDDVFIEQLAQVRRRWLVKRTPTGMLYVDLSFSKPIASSTPSAIQTKYNLVPDATGQVCIVIPGAAESKPVALKGWEAVCRGLSSQHTILVWETIAAILQQHRRSSVADQQVVQVAYDALAQLAAVAVEKCYTDMQSVVAAGGPMDMAGVEHDDDDVLMIDSILAAVSNRAPTTNNTISIIPKPKGVKNIEAFITLPRAQVEFEARALHGFSALLKHSQVPSLIKQICRDQDVDISGDLANWILYAACSTAIETELKAASAVEIRRVDTAGTELEASWDVVKNAKTLGRLTVRSMGDIQWQSSGERPRLRGLGNKVSSDVVALTQTEVGLLLQQL